MPELPEVETIRRTLLKLIQGKTIAQVDVFWPKLVKEPADIYEFQKNLTGQSIQDIGRRGKFIKILLDDFVLISHLRMEGRYGLFSKEDPIEQHTHALITFTDGTELRYRDVRKFGTMHLIKKGLEEKVPPLVDLGVEPFSDAFTDEYLWEKLKKTNRKIKVALLDQKIVVGLGNIYVDEALFRAGIHPERQANSLQPEEIKVLHREIISTLQEAVAKGGSTIRSYVNSQGEIGMFQLELFVYACNNEQCKKCGTTIQKIKVGGRGTHFCPKCQN